MTTSIERLSFLDLMKQIDEAERAQRDRGTLFELLTKAYLENEPIYRQLFDSVWLLNEVPNNYRIPKKDTGIDLVAKKRNSEELFAIQCKYYSPDYKIKKSDIDSFLNEVGKSYYSEGIIITSTPHWTNNAEQAIIDRDKNIARIDLTQLQESRVDWSKFSFTNPKKVKLQTPKTPRAHQEEAIKAVIEGFKTEDRGKLIMAPGTGKTYTSMVISERLAEKKDDTFKVLYLVPSIQLLSQALKGWSADSKFRLDTIAVCSDRKVTKKSGRNELEDIAAADIGYPATTNYQKLLKYQRDIERTSSKGNMLVVFSTYQSIDVTIEAQKKGFYEFDLIIADEAHRTTGSTLAGYLDSHFVKVHSNTNVKASKRLYQTATPRIYGESAQQKADEKSVLLYDMDNKDLYGEELFYLGFGEAVHRGILSDYKVMVLAVDEAMVQKEMQHVFADQNNELQFDDVTKIIGTWNGLLKRKSNSNELYGEPMRRAIAFTGTIQKSKDITRMYQYIINEFVDDISDSNVYRVDIRHADGTMNALEKNKKIDWLKDDVPKNSVKILSNARFLTEGVDVPDLDAVLFLQPRRSEIDIAQAVGRVMRKSMNKDYGYVILPIGVPEGVSANQVLDDNEKYAVVWDILNALRSIDERFDATINKLELNQKKPNKINVIGIGKAPEVNEETGDYIVDTKSEQLELSLDEKWTELEHAIYGKIVDKVGTTRYWENWSKDVAKIAQQHITRIKALLDAEKSTSHIFNEFLKSLHHNINNSISREDAIEMLAQHMITKPVFDVLFEEESFDLNNPVSKSMNKMVQRLESFGFNKDTEELEGFYESVRLRAEGIDNLISKQNIIKDLYERFFSEAFPKTTDSLGIVFTPVEVVDFIIYSVNEVLKKYFNITLSDENVNVLDPFTGTGTFITRLIQSGLISKKDLLRKYTREIFANEIVLLSYYIAAINIEETFKEINKSQNLDESYYPFEGVVLTDTFESNKQENSISIDLFGENNERLKKQNESSINIIIGNPPYSAKQSSDSDDNRNVSYPHLDSRINESYGKLSTAQNKANLKDSYIRAIRWASDRLGEDGVIGFITNGSFIDAIALDGLRATLYSEFNQIYVYNLRGFIRGKSREVARKEGDNIFDILQGVAIIILVKQSGCNNHNIFYRQTDDFLSRKDKLNNLTKENNILNIPLEPIVPNEKNDWINQRTSNFDSLWLLGSKKSEEPTVFINYSGGLKTGTDTWSNSFSEKTLIMNINNMLEFYNNNLLSNKPVDSLMNSNSFKSTATLRKLYTRGEKLSYNYDNIYTIMYRPFTKKKVYFDDKMVDRKYQLDLLFPDKDSQNLVINFSNKTGGNVFSTLVSNVVPDVNLFSGGSQGMPVKFIEKSRDINLFGETTGITKRFRNEFNKITNLTDDESIMAYIYGILHSKDYIKTYQLELNKQFPRIPLVRNYSDFISVGNKLIKLHLNYENVKPYKETIITVKNNHPSYYVNKMIHPWAVDENGNKIRNEEGKHFRDKSRINYNKDISIENIPSKAFKYVINGRPAVEWIMNQYQITKDKSTGIVDNPNDYSDDPKYIFNLLLSIINVSVKTIDLIDSLPPLDIIDNYLEKKSP